MDKALSSKLSCTETGLVMNCYKHNLCCKAENLSTKNRSLQKPEFKTTLLKVILKILRSCQAYIAAYKWQLEVFEIYQKFLVGWFWV